MSDIQSQKTASSSSSESSTLHETNYDNETFEDDTITQCSTISHKSSSNYENKTFTTKQIMEIERENQILMKKILTFHRKPSKPKLNLPNKFHVNSAAINRKRNQRKIDWENQILLRKIQTVKPSITYT